jgi:serine/threonine protein kinase
MTPRGSVTQTGENLHYLVMKYVDGGTLGKYCSRSSLLPVERIVQIILKCTRALQFAHTLGATHRDSSPAADAGIISIPTRRLDQASEN